MKIKKSKTQQRNKSRLHAWLAVCHAAASYSCAMPPARHFTSAAPPPPPRARAGISIPILMLPWYTAYTLQLFADLGFLTIFKHTMVHMHTEDYIKVRYKKLFLKMLVQKGTILILIYTPKNKV